jgi:folate-binding protein YgfZ
MTLPLEQSLPSLAQLPENYLIELSHFSAVSLHGEEQSKYLQGQVTCDVNTLAQDKLLYGAHCNAKGKVFSCFRLLDRNDEHLLFQPKSTISASLAELKKFGVFAKVEIKQTEELGFYALAGTSAAELLRKKFQQVPDSLSPVIQVDNTTLVYLAGSIDRYILIDDNSAIEQIISSFSLPVYTSKVWDLLEINQGIPLLSTAEIEQYVPQMLNMQAINGISFTKGCYLGQETVARMQYLGKNKKALFLLTGELDSISADDIIEKQLGENWRKAGDITNIYHADNKKAYIQAILANDLEEKTNLRIKGQESSSISIEALPYSLNTEQD